MASEIHLTHPTGLNKTAYVGWSWTSFFFGGFPALFRGDILGFCVWFAASVALIVFTWGIGNVIGWFVWAAIYNRWHSRRLVERGYVIGGAGQSAEMLRARVMG